MPRDRRRSSDQYVDPASALWIPVSKSEIELGEWVRVPTTYAGGAKGEFLLVFWACGGLG